jgi:hypothetical protein
MGIQPLVSFDFNLLIQQIISGIYLISFVELINVLHQRLSTTLICAFYVCTFIKKYNNVNI